MRLELWALDPSVSDPYSLNPDQDQAKNLNPDQDQAKNLNPDPDPSFFLPLSEKNTYKNKNFSSKEVN